MENKTQLLTYAEYVVMEQLQSVNKYFNFSYSSGCIMHHSIILICTSLMTIKSKCLKLLEKLWSDGSAGWTFVQYSQERLLGWILGKAQT